MQDKVYILFGDSIAYGVGDKASFGWFNRIRKMKNQSNNYYFNLAIPGENSGDVLNRVDRELKARCNKQDEIVVIYALGIKDALLLNQESDHDKNFSKSVLELIRITQKYTSCLYFLGLLDVDLQVRSEYKSTHIKKIDETLKQACKISEVPYIDMKGLISKENLSDGLHPNEFGHQVIADYLFPLIFKD